MRFFKLGMLAATSLAVSSIGAAAADLPAYKASPPPVYNWSGLHWGANVGYSWGLAKFEADLTGIASASRSERMDGGFLGVQSGYTYQFGTWVLGLESDFQFSAQKGGSTFPAIFAPATITTDERLLWFGTSRTRLGVLANPSILLYGTAGVAYGQVRYDATVNTPGFGSFTGTFKDVKAGWTVGAGVEAAFGGGWSAKLEYLYIDLGKTEHSFGTLGLGTIARESLGATDNIVRLGMNYRWGG